MSSRQRSPGAHSYLNEFGLVLIAVRENTQMGNHGGVSVREKKVDKELIIEVGQGLGDLRDG